MKKGKLWKISKRLRNYRQWRIGKIWGSAVVVLMLGSLYGTACIQAGDLGGFDVSVSEGENWSLPDNWQEDTSGWEEESNTGNATESGATSSAQNNPAENPDNTDHTASVGRESENIFSSAAESPQPNKQQQNNSQKNDRQNNMRQENNTQVSNQQENNTQISTPQNNKQQNFAQNNKQENNPTSSNPVQQSPGSESQVQQVSEEKSQEQKTPERKETEPQLSDLEKTDTKKADPQKKEMADMEAADAKSKVYISQEERQKSREQDRAVNFRRTKDMTFFHKKQVDKGDILYLTVTRLNIYQILSVRLNGKECGWDREGSRIVLKDSPTQGKNKVEVRFFREDGQITGMEPWIFTCT
nr:hypothetical protein [uncultured Blautia sp.]